MRRSRTIKRPPPSDLIRPEQPGRPCLIVIRGTERGRVEPLPEKEGVVIGRGSSAWLILDDPSVSRRHARIEPEGDGFRLRDLDSTNGVFVNGVRTRSHLIGEGDRIQIGRSPLLKFCHQDDIESEYRKRVYDSATRDPVTGIANRALFLETLEGDLRHASAHGRPVSLLLIDLDRFKSVNDRHGHARGDEVLRATAETIQRSVRPQDLLARYGGEEFVVLLRFTAADRAAVIAEGIRRAVEAQESSLAGTGIRITASIGIATLRPGGSSSAGALLTEADAALYEAKRRGRNRVVQEAPATSDVQPGGPESESTCRVRAVRPLAALDDSEPR